MEANWGEGYVIRSARSDEKDIKPLALPQTVLQGIDPTSPSPDQVMVSISPLFEGILGDRCRCVYPLTTLGFPLEVFPYPRTSVPWC
jgi:hypothetical protein